MGLIPKIPDITPLQYLILATVGPDLLSGRKIREHLLNAYGKEMTLPAFYNLMSRLEQAGFVQGVYEQRIIKGQGLRERHYKNTEEGIRACDEAREFFAKVAHQPGQLAIDL